MVSTQFIVVIYQPFGFFYVEKERAVLVEVPPKCYLHGHGGKEARWLDVPPPRSLVNGVSSPDT